MNKRHSRFVAGAAGFLVLGGLVGFAVKAVADGIPSPNPLYYAGTLTEANTPVTGTRAITVNLWPDGTSTGTPLCQTVSSTTSVTAGRFRIALAASCKAAINANPGAFVEIVDGATSLGRTPVGAVPYAVEADHAVRATTATSATSAGTAASAMTAASATTAASAVSAMNATNATNASSAAVSTAVAAASVRVATDACVSCGAGCVDCSCQTNEVAISGGTFSGAVGNMLNASQQASTIGGNIQTWRMSCVDNTGTRQTCVTPFAVCLRVQ